MATVILQSVSVTLAVVLATNTKSMSVVLAIALVPHHLLATIIIIITVPTTYTTGHAMET